MNLGERLRNARQEAGMTQDELSKRLDVSRQTISSWENGRTAPDIGFALRLSKLYNVSLDKLLSGETGEEVIQQLEDIAAKRKKACQRNIELGIIGQLLGNLLAGQGMTFAGEAIFLLGLFTTYISILVHLRVYEHSRNEIIRGCLGVGLHFTLNCITWLRALGMLAAMTTASASLLHSTLLLAALILILSANVWHIDWKSTRLWLIVFLYVASPLLTISKALNDTGMMVTHNPFPGDYRVAQVLYPEGQEAPHCIIDLNSTIGYIKETGDSYDDYEKMREFSFTKPGEHDPASGIWTGISEEDPDLRYEVVLGKDDSLTLAKYDGDALQWKWLLKDDTYKTSVMLSGVGSTTFWKLGWVETPQPSPDPSEWASRKSYLGDKGTLTITCPHYADELPITEEYYHDGQWDEVRSYTLKADPEKPYQFVMEIAPRYDGQRQFMHLRIPFEGGEYSLTYSFG